MKIAIISASTRAQRLSHRVALALEQQITKSGDHTVEILDLGESNFPLMEYQLKNHPNPPAGLREFSQSIKEAEAVIFVSPEYNGSYTAALKNALDYLGENEFTRKAVGVASVSDGPMGGMRGAMLMQQLVLGVGGFPIPQLFWVTNVAQRFDESGNLLDEAFQKKIDFFLNGFFWLAEAVTEKKMVVA